LEGDRNTAYFHAIANQSFRKKRIESLRGAVDIVHETSDILKVAMSFYKDMFKKESRSFVSLENGFWDSEDLVPPRDCVELEKPFSMEEIKSVIFSCYPEGVSWP
jgi:hypothetical protein